MVGRRILASAILLLATAVVLLALNPAALEGAGYSITKAMLESGAWVFAQIQTFPGGVKTNSVSSATVDTPIATVFNTTTAQGTSTLANALPAVAQASIDYTIANATAPPVFVSESILGSCTNAEAFYKFYALWTDPGGTTTMGTSLQYTPTTTSRKINLSKPTSVPANATKWNVAWEKASAPGTFWNCSASPVALGSNIACACVTNIGSPSASNTTGVTPIAAINDGRVSFSTYNGTIIQQARTAIGFGTDGQLTLSLDGGSTFSPILTAITGYNSGPQVVTACPSGCQYADLTAACTAKAASSTQSSPIFFSLGPGTYTTMQSCGLTYGGILGWGRGVTRIVPSSQNGVALEISTSSNVIVAGMTVVDATAIHWVNNPSGTNYLVDMDMDTTQSTAGSGGDCIASAAWANGSILHMRGNTAEWGATPGSDCFAIQSSAGGLTLYASDNVIKSSASVTGNADGGGFFLVQGDTHYLYNNTFDMTRGGTTGGGPKAYYIAVTNGGSGATWISGGRALLHSTSANGTNSSAVGIFIQTSTPNTASVEVRDFSADVTVDDATTGTAQGLYANDPDVPVTIYGSHFSATGGTTTFGIDGAAAGKITIGPDSDFGSANMATNAILKGAYLRPALAAKPAKCNAGDMYLDSTAGAVALCLCTSANTWTAVGGTGICA